jgi:hypothetical protein
VARSAFSLIQQRYSQTGSGGNAIASRSDAALASMVALPGLADASPAIQQNERAYQFGASVPMPAQDPTQCAYFWTAIVRKPPAETGEGRSIDLYILVFHKGAIDQTFAASQNEFPGVRTPGDLYVPSLTAVQTMQSPVVRPGEYALGQQSGTVYRRIIDSNGQATYQPPLDPADTTLLVAPPADGTTGSPLVYVYQTTLSF